MKSESVPQHTICKSAPQDTGVPFFYQTDCGELLSEFHVTKSKGVNMMYISIYFI